MTKLTIKIGEVEIAVELNGCNAEFDGSTLKIHAPSMIINNVPLLPFTQPAINPNTYPWGGNFHPHIAPTVWQSPNHNVFGGLQCPATS